MGKNMITLSEPKILSFFADKAVDPTEWILRRIEMEEEILRHHGARPEGLSPEWVTAKMQVLIEQSRDQLLDAVRHEQQTRAADITVGMTSELSTVIRERLASAQEASGRPVLEKKVQELSKSLQVSIEKQGLMNAWLERMNGRQSSDRGKAGEQAYLQLMSKHFIGYPRDVSTVPHSADIEYDEDGRPPLLIEVKNRDTVVPKSHIDRFYADRHGILVSVDSNIANRANFTFEVRPGNLIAFFVANNGFDMDRLRNAVDLLYLIAKQLESKDDDTTAISKTTLQHLLDSLTTFDNNVKSAKDHQNRSLQALNEISANVVKGIVKAALTPKESQYKCQYCGKAMDNRKVNVDRHEQKFCPDNPASQKYSKRKNAHFT